MSDSNFSINWLQFRYEGNDPYFAVKMLGLEGQEWEHSEFSSEVCLYFNTLHSKGVSIYYDCHYDEHGVLCMMSFEGCRTFERHSDLSDKWLGLFRSLMSYDIFIGILGIRFLLPRFDIYGLVPLFCCLGFTLQNELDTCTSRNLYFCSDSLDIHVRDCFSNEDVCFEVWLRHI